MVSLEAESVNKINHDCDTEFFSATLKSYCYDSAPAGGHALKFGVSKTSQSIIPFMAHSMLCLLMQISWQLTGQLFKTLSASLMWIVNAFGGRILF